jgi:hypothetical protein
MKPTKTSWTITTKRTISAFALCALAASALGANVKVVLPSEAKREFSTAQSEPQSMPAGREFLGKEFTVPVPDGAKYVIVADRASDTIAWRDVQTIANGVWTVGADEWRLGTLEVEASGDSGPLEAGVATITVGGRSFDATVRGGKAAFFGLPPGDGELVVKWGQVGNEKSSPAQKVALSLNRTEGAGKISVALPRDESKPTRAQPEEETITPRAAPNPETGGVWLRWVLIPVAIGAAFGALVLLMRLLKRNERRVTGHLEALGIKIPDATADPAPAPAAPEPEPLVAAGHCPFCGNALDACVCRVAPATAADSGGPRFEAEGGASIALADGAAEIGREGGGCEHTLSDATVSRRHAEVRVEGSRVFVRDLGSSNGTFVNGARIDAETEVHPGDTVQFGALLMRRKG